MTRKRSRRKTGARRAAPAAVPAKGSTVTALDSEDEAGTYAPSRSPADTGESDDGVLARGPGASPSIKEAMP